jgi:hypothetical protein
MNNQSNKIEFLEMDVWAALSKLVTNKLKWKIWHKTQPPYNHSENHSELVEMINAEFSLRESE